MQGGQHRGLHRRSHRDGEVVEAVVVDDVELVWVARQLEHQGQVGMMLVQDLGRRHGHIRPGRGRRLEEAAPQPIRVDG